MSVSLPMGAIASAVLLAAAGVLYAVITRNDEEGVADKLQKAKPKGSIGRKMGLLTLVTLLENDATRKVVLTALRAIAKRS
ncbi:MAG: hypothetical protein ACR2GA_07420 [Chloroflexota bacterium]